MLISPISQIQTQQLMTSQIRLHIEYLPQSYNILVLIVRLLKTEIDKKSSLTDGFLFNRDSW